MRVFEIDPLHAVDVDAVVVLQMAAQPGAGGLGVGAHADAAAFEIRQREFPARGIVEQRAVLEASEHHAGHQHQRLAVRLRLQKGDDRHLADVVGGLAHHLGERLVHRRDVGEVERDAIGLDLVALQRRGVRIVAERDAQRLLRGHLAATVIGLLPRPQVCQTLPTSTHRTITMHQHHWTKTDLSPPMTLILSNDDVDKLLTMPECIDALEEAYVELAEGRGITRTRSDCITPTQIARRGLRPQVDGRRVSQARRRRGPHQLRHRDGFPSAATRSCARRCRRRPATAGSAWCCCSRSTTASRSRSCPTA